MERFISLGVTVHWKYIPKEGGWFALGVIFSPKGKDKILALALGFWTLAVEW